jgi:folate-binding protein YgfZ
MNATNDMTAIAAGVGLADRSDRLRIDVSGPDRAKFLHNLTTNEVKRLATGRGCEAFVTSTQGKTIGYVILLAADDRILVRSDPRGMDLALPHLRKYGVFDDVAIDDRSAATFELHLLGARADELVSRCVGELPDRADYSHMVSHVGGCPVRLVREQPAGMPGLTVIGDRASAHAVAERLESAAHDIPLAWTTLDPAAFDLLRIEAGTPVFGKEVTERNLPQEIGRDSQAISFVKGCYLGQETVARIDALGHVNQILKGLLFPPDAPAPSPGSALEDGGKRVGVVTSAVVSPVRKRAIALGFVRISHSQAGTLVELPRGDGLEPSLATVCDLPLPPEP